MLWVGEQLDGDDPSVDDQEVADLDACFDERTFLRNVHTIIARLDTIAASSPLAPAVSPVPAPAVPDGPTAAEVSDADR